MFLRTSGVLGRFRLGFGVVTICLILFLAFNVPDVGMEAVALLFVGRLSITGNGSVSATGHT